MCVTFLFVVTLGCSLICSQLELVSEESALSKLHKKALKRPSKGKPRRPLRPSLLAASQLISTTALSVSKILHQQICLCRIWHPERQNWLFIKLIILSLKAFAKIIIINKAEEEVGLLCL